MILLALMCLRLHLCLSVTCLTSPFGEMHMYESGIAHDVPTRLSRLANSTIMRHVVKRYRYCRQGSLAASSFGFVSFRWKDFRKVRSMHLSICRTRRGSMRSVYFSSIIMLHDQSVLHSQQSIRGGGQHAGEDLESVGAACGCSTFTGMV